MDRIGSNEQQQHSQKQQLQVAARENIMNIVRENCVRNQIEKIDVVHSVCSYL